MAVRGKIRRARPVPSAPVAALAGVPVGPGLAAALAGLDLPGLTGYETVLVLKARNRQGNHERGLLLTTVAEVLARTDADHGRRSGDQDADINEVRAALMLSRRAARSLCGLAQDLADRLPTVLAAMTAGRLDQPRARIFSVWTQELDDRHAWAVVDALLPHAHTMSTGQLIEAIQLSLTSGSQARRSTLSSWTRSGRGDATKSHCTPAGSKGSSTTTARPT